MEFTIKALKSYIKAKDFHPELADKYFLKLAEEVGVNRIEACHDPRNPNSGAVMKKCGLIYEGTYRQSGKNNMDGFCDEVWYAILADDYIIKDIIFRYRVNYFDS